MTKGQVLAGSVTKRSRPRVWIGPIEVAGYYAGLERGLVKAGIEARLVTLGLPHPFHYGQRIRNPPAARWESRIRSGSLPRAFWAPVAFLLRVTLLVWMVWRFDVFIFGFGRSVLPWRWDLAILRLLGKHVIVNVGHGSEARPPVMDCLGDQSDPAPELGKRLRSETRRRRRNLKAIERYANFVIGYPLTAHLLSKPFVNWIHIGVPTSPGTAAQTTDAIHQDGRIRLLHAPSVSSVKGTPKILGILEQLCQERDDVDYVVLQNASNEAVKMQIRSATLVVDQLWSDMPVPGLAGEAASLSVPSLVAGNGWNDLATFIPIDIWPPSFTCSPEELESTLRYLISNPDQIRSTGLAARRYVENNWAEEVVARNYIRMWNGSIPKEWFVDPSTIRYRWGAGSSREAVLSAETQLLAQGMEPPGRATSRR